MQVWEAVALGVVQGLTEFLPISSTGHLLVVRTWMGHPHPEDAFTTVIQLGTVVAVFAYFRADVARLLKSNQNTYLQELEEILGRTVIVKGDPQLHQEKFDLA